MMPLEVSGRLLTRNALFNLAGQAGPLLVAVVSIPFIIGGLGVERFGILSIAWLAPEYLVFIDLGLARASTRYAAEALGRGDSDRLLRLAWTAMVVQVGLGLLGAVALIGVTPLLTQYLLNIPPALETEGRVIFQLVALSIPLVLVSGTLTGVLAAAQRFDLANGVTASLNMAIPALTLGGVLWFDWQLREIGVMLIVCRLAALLAQYRLCVYVFPFFGRPSLHASELKTLLMFGGWVTVSSFAVPVLLYLDRFIIGATLTMAAVAYYAIPYDMITRLWIIPASLGATLFPAFSMLTGKGTPERLAALLASSMKSMLLILGLAVVGITAFAGDILRIWLGVAFERESALALQILAVGILINSMVHVQYAMIQGLGRPDLTAKIHLLQLPLHIVLAWTLIGFWGVSGAALAQSIRLSVEGLLVLLVAFRLASLPLQRLVSGRLLQSSVLLFVFVGLAIGISYLPLAAWERVAATGLVLVAVGFWMWQYSLDQRDRDQLSRLFRRTA